ncbi:MAG: proton-conducting transporter transmembrane domain-containing protein [Acidiferrobacteraceae bacterium]
MSAGALLVMLVLAPACAVAGSLIAHRARVSEYLNLVASVVSASAALPLTVMSLGGPYRYWHGYVLLDPLGAWVLLCVALVYLLSSIYAIGYMRLLQEDGRLHIFYALFSGFALTMLVAPLMNNVGVYWIAIEMTTLVSTFLIGFEVGAESIEAAWKYIIVVSAGISLALLGTILFYWAGTFVLGPSYDMTWGVLTRAAARLNPDLMILAFLLVLVGYGTKTGLAPMHTWLPDAHSEGPAPVSAMLSGALLNTAMLGVVRFLGVADAARLGHLPRAALIGFGIFSLLIASFFIVRQEGVKRLMAYSSVEHMGIMALGFGFGGPLGVAGALYHMLNHAINKPLMFFGAGNVMRAYGTKEIPQIRGVLQSFPVTGMLWLAGAVAITGAPPFGLFLSEISILRAGLDGAYAWVAFAMAVLLIIIFIGFLNHFRRMLFTPGHQSSGMAVQLGAWCLVPMWFSVIPLLIFGLWWPQSLWHYFAVVQRTVEGLP